MGILLLWSEAWDWLVPWIQMWSCLFNFSSLGTVHFLWGSGDWWDLKKSSCRIWWPPPLFIRKFLGCPPFFPKKLRWPPPPPPFQKKTNKHNKTKNEKTEKERFLFLFVNVDTFFLEFNSWKKNTNIWRIKGVAIRAVKFEAARIRFLGDVFDAVAVFVAEALYYHRYRHCKTWKNFFGYLPFTPNIFLPGPPFAAIFFGMTPLNPTRPPPSPLPDKKWTEWCENVIDRNCFSF